MVLVVEKELPVEDLAQEHLVGPVEAMVFLNLLEELAEEVLEALVD